MASAAAGPAAPGGGGPLSFMGCMREASPPPFDHDNAGQHFYQQQHHQYHAQQQQQQQRATSSSRPAGLPTGGANANDFGHGFDAMPKEPKKRRFHPLRGLRRIFRRKSRGAADVGEITTTRCSEVGGGNSGGGPTVIGGSGDRNGEHPHHHHHHHHHHHRCNDREEVTVKDPAGRVVDEIRSRSASELLTDSCDRDRLFLRRRGMEESILSNLLPQQLHRAGPGQLSVSHDSVFPGEVLPHTRPLSSLDLPSSLERRTTAKASGNDTEHKESQSSVTAAQQRHRISLRVLEQIKTVIENRNQVAAACTTTTDSTGSSLSSSSHNRFVSRDRSSGGEDTTQAKILKKDAPGTPTAAAAATTETPSSPLKEELPEPTNGNLNHDAALHRISVRPKNRRPPRRSANSSQSSNNSSLLDSSNLSNGNLNSTSSTNGLPRIDSASEISIDTLDSLEGTIPPDSNGISLGVEPMSSTPPTTPQEQPASKPIPILRKSSSRLSRNSEVFEELEAKLPMLRKPAVSPDSLDSTLDSRSSADVLEAGEDNHHVKSTPPPKPSPRTASVSSDDRVITPISASSPVDRRRRTSSNRLSKSPDSLESTSPGWLTKSTEGFDKLSECDRNSNSSPANSSNNRDSTTNLANLSRNSNSSLASLTRDINTNFINRESNSNLVNRDSNTSLVNINRNSNTSLVSLNQENNANIVNLNSNINQKPVAAARKLLLKPISKSQERVCCTKSSDNLETLEALNSDDSMERRRSSFEIRPRRIMSKSTECFDSSSIEHQQQLLASKAEEKRKRATVSEINLFRGTGAGNRNSKLLSKSSESFEAISSLAETHLEKASPVETEKPQNMWRGSKRITNSSESSDNLDLEENCKVEIRNKSRRSTPKRLSSGSSVNFMDEQESMLTRKPPSRLQKSSESSELGSTDTLDSERRNTMKSSDSDETLDSLEKDLQESPSQSEPDKKIEDTLDTVIDRKGKSKVEDEEEHTQQQEKEKVSSYWRRRTNSQESKDTNNLDIQLIAYTLVSKIQENGNSNGDHNENNHEEDKILSSPSSVNVFPKKKQFHQQSSSSDDNKTLSSTFNNLLSSKNDEDLQNMLNGNISEVSTESTKSFKEKLNMFKMLEK